MTAWQSSAAALAAGLLCLAPTRAEPRLPLAPPRMVWRVPGEPHGQPAADSAHVYFLSARHELLALNRLNGRTEWVAALTGAQGETMGSVVRLSGQVVVTGDDDLVAVDRRTGRMRWRFRAGEGETPGVYLGDAAGGTVFAGSASATVFAIDAASGQLRWRAKLPVEGPATAFEPVAARGFVLCAYTSRTSPPRGGLVAFGVQSGALAWHAPFGDSAESAAAAGGGPVVAGSAAVAASTDGRIHAIHLPSGRRLWTAGPVRVPTGIWSPDFQPLIAAGRTVIAGSTSGVVRGYDADRVGHPQWTLDPGLGSFLFKATAAGHVACFVSFSGTLIAVDARRGRVTWTVGGGAMRFAWPPLLHRGHIYAATTNAYVAMSTP